MEQLAEDQSKYGEEMGRIIANYKKDPLDRNSAKDNKYRDELSSKITSIHLSDNGQDAWQLPSPSPSANMDEASNMPPRPASRKEQDSTTQPKPQPSPQARMIQAEPSQLLKAVRRQTALMKSLNNLISDIQAKTEIPQPQAYYEVQIKTLHEYKTQLACNENVIWENCSEENPHGYDANMYYETELQLQDTLVSLQQKSYELNQATTRNASMSQPLNSSVKLPKIALPSFSGDYLKWTHFHDLYTQLIHNQPMSNAQKMVYLTSHLSGEALILIKHLPVSEENYMAAWTTLRNRYANKRLLVTALLNRLLSQPVCQIESAAAIKSLHDTTNECLLGLGNLGSRSHQET